MNNMRIEYHSQPDDLGRCEFTLFWMDDYHPGHPLGENHMAERGQCFFAKPEAYGFPSPGEPK